uniref:Uncharacterized protein n=1 Tax=Kalanchoe fedtschenkoi TaxID=63787 RepID=A0A7N0RFL8_KALFE
MYLNRLYCLVRGWLICNTDLTVSLPYDQEEGAVESEQSVHAPKLVPAQDGCKTD